MLSLFTLHIWYHFSCPFCSPLFFCAISKSISSCNCAYNIEHFFDFFPLFSSKYTRISGNKVENRFVFSQITPKIQGTFLTFCPIIVYFYTKMPNKSNFPQITPIIQGTLLTFVPRGKTRHGEEQGIVRC